MDWKIAHEIAGTFQNAIAAAALMVGAVWAYIKFVRFRTLRPRVEFNLACSRKDIDDSDALVVLTVKFTNKGQTKIDLRKGKHPRCFLKYALIPDKSTGAVASIVTLPPHCLEHLDAAFVPHKWVEPGETIDDTKAMRIRRKGVLALQLEMVIFGARKWSASAAFPLIGLPQSESINSEDEQDDYEEAEALREGLKNVLARVRRLNERERASLQSLVGEIEALLDRPETDWNFVSRAKDLANKAEEALRAIE